MSSKKFSLAILGSTGSIGITTLKIIKKYPNNFKINLLACNKNKKVIFKQIKEFLPKYVIIHNKKNYNFFKKIKFKKKVNFFQNLKDFNKKKKIKFDKVVLGISSIDGLDYAFSFIKYSKEILLANKETIVCGGKIFLSEAKSFNCKIKSIDSEHFSIYEILKNENKNSIHTIYLTASGGPFLKKNKKYYKKINYKEALKHPKWKMGKKISVDSATMANKVLELMEACFLFDINFKKIKIKIHTQSHVHAVIIFKNGLVKFIAHNTSMAIPIINCLISNDEINFKKNFFTNEHNLTLSFNEKALKKFRLIRAGYKALSFGHRACIVFNVINDYLVNLYLNKKIFFYEIEHKLNKVIFDKKLSNYYKIKIKNKNDIFKTISFAKKIIQNN